MSDERNYEEWAKDNISGGNFITFDEYVRRVIGDPKRKEDLDDLVKVFGSVAMEEIIQGKRIAQVKDLIPRILSDAVNKSEGK